MSIATHSAQSNSRQTLNRFLLLFVPVAVICIGCALSLYQFESNANQKITRSSEAAAVQVGSRSLRSEVQLIISDLAYLAEQEGFIDVISDEKQADHSKPLVSWLSFSRIKGIYDQIRWLDLSGQERLRVDFDEMQSFATPANQLQHKGNRYYFTDTIKLGRGEFYISPFDLNIENGKIEQPLKPVIRIGTPVFDKDGEKKGVLLLNYLGSRLLQEFDQIMNSASSQGWILNREGYWLKGSSTDREWGFMYQGSEVSMASHYPKAWKRIIATEQGQFENEQGLWTFVTVYPLMKDQSVSAGSHSVFAPNQPDFENRGYFWKAVSYLPREEYLASSRQTSIKLLTATAILLSILGIGCWWIASAWVRQKEFEEALNEKRERYRAAIASAHDGFLRIDTEGHILDANEAYVQRSGYSREELLLLKISNLDVQLYEEDTGTYLQERGESKNSLFTSEHCSKSGEKWPVEVSSNFIKTKHGGYFASFLRDITERKKAEAEQQRLQCELQQAQKIESLGQLTGGIAHDFNNLLAVMLGNTELALMHCHSDKQSKLIELLKQVIKAGGRAADLVSKIMIYSRTESISVQSIQLHLMLTDDLKMLSSTLPSSIEVHTEFDECLPSVRMDATELNQLLLNLCINARDAMEGKGRITLRLGWAKGVDVLCTSCHKQLDADWIEFSITDTGSGIAQDVLERIFDPYFTTKDVGKGTGMGMAVVHSIIHNHGGHILVQTQIGKGTTFRLLFPPAEGDAVENQDDDTLLSALPQGNGEQILVVDDEPDLANFLGNLLESSGYQPTVLTSSKEALEIFTVLMSGNDASDLFTEKVNEFALVITDQTMPEMTGVEMINGMRKVCPNIPVILNTGFSHDINAETAIQMDISCLQKPVRAENLLHTVGDLLDKTGKPLH